MRKSFTFSVAILLCFIFTGCQMNNGKFWNLNSRTGSFQTNDIERAQKEIDFQLVLPNYIPQGQITCPTIRGQIRGSEGHERVDIIYSGADTALFIEESSLNITAVLGNPEQVERYLQDGIEVQCLSRTFNGKLYQYYTWLYNGISFYIETQGVDKDESKHIVESMIG